MTDKKHDVTQSFPAKRSQAETIEPLPRPYAAPLQIDAAGLSDPGKLRSNNQDHFLVARVGRSLDTLMTSLPDGEIPERFDQTGHVMMVADGMGGAAGGEVASRVAISTLVNIVLDVPDWIMKLDEANAKELMRRAIGYYRKVDSTLAEMARADPKLSGMGTTMTVGYTIGDQMTLSHVGDSRAYLCRAGELKQLTRDHTHVQSLVDAGLISREEAATHRLRNVLTNAVGGSEKSIEVDVQRLALADGDRLLFCTDGLTEVVSDAEITEVLNRGKAPEVVCRSLVDLCLDRGAPDNVTVIAARATLAAAEAPGRAQTSG
jgi:serine/threonine protein phosphatase PrpC